MPIPKLLLFKAADAVLERKILDSSVREILANQIVTVAPDQYSDIAARVNALHSSNQRHSDPNARDLGKEWYSAATAAVVAVKQEDATPKSAGSAVFGASQGVRIDPDQLDLLQSAASHYAAREGMAPDGIHLEMNKMMTDMGITAGEVTIAISNAAKAIVTVIIYAKKQDELIVKYRELEKKIGTTPVPDDVLREEKHDQLEARIADFKAKWQNCKELIKAAGANKIKLPMDDLMNDPTKRSEAEGGLKVAREIVHYDLAAAEDTARLAQIQIYFEDYLNGNKKSLERMLVEVKGEHAAREARQKWRKRAMSAREYGVQFSVGCILPLIILTAIGGVMVGCGISYWKSMSTLPTPQQEQKKGIESATPESTGKASPSSNPPNVIPDPIGVFDQLKQNIDEMKKKYPGYFPSDQKNKE